MLTREDNELLCRVGPGTPMGDMMRRYWLPILLSWELSEADGRPRQMRLLGEELIAFRDSEGRIGLIEEHCAHRGASLFYGRNEECGLRCVYHGWKYDVTGSCVDMPNEPEESSFKEKIRLKAYHTVERNGVIWTFMGDQSKIPPGPPEVEWNMVPESQRYVTKRYEECNWAQALEGGIDSSHSSFLHSHLNESDYQGTVSQRGMGYKSKDRHPRFDTVATDYGLLVGARRNADDSYYWRITQFMMPFYTIIPPYGPSPTLGGHAWVPMDDQTTMAWTATWHPLRPLTDAELDRLRHADSRTWDGGLHLPEELLAAPTLGPAGNWRALGTRENAYLLDWERQKTSKYSGIPTIALQDQAMQESMGPIYDRTREHLGTSDSGIIRTRQMWIRAAKALRDRGVAPPGVDLPEAYRVRSASAVLPADADWVKATEHMRAGTPDLHHDAA